VRKFEISSRPAAEADLLGLYCDIAEDAGIDVAGAYVDRIEAACRTLETFPERRTRRDGIRPSLRTLGFERRATIGFLVKRSEVVILRVFYGGQDYERILRGRATD